MTAELYYMISLANKDSPSIRVTWLDNLASVQASNQHWEEAAICKIHCAYLVALYLRDLGTFKLDMKHIDNLAPGLDKEEPHPNHKPDDSRQGKRDMEERSRSSLSQRGHHVCQQGLPARAVHRHHRVPCQLCAQGEGLPRDDLGPG